MPGCTAPNCSNSSQKGFKLYHFPSDEERCALWMKYCGREEGWKPTRHTCICEVHFEETEFESHRADGLKKLKPYAVPTKFSHSKILIAKKMKFKRKFKRKFQEIEIIEHHKNSKALLVANPVLMSKRDTNTEVTSNINISPTDKYKLIKKNGRQLSTKGMKYFADNFVVHLKKSSKMIKKHNENYEVRKKNETCFMCNENTNNYVSLNSYTTTTNIRLDQKLIQLVAQECDILVEDSGVICTICAQILNFIDYVENILSTLTKGVLNRMRSKFGMKSTGEVDLLSYIKSLSTLHSFYSDKKSDEDQPATKHINETQAILVREEMCKINKINDSENNQDDEQVEKSSLSLECHICAYKTKFKALMVYHLRQHIYSSYSCDFCSTPVTVDSTRRNITMEKVNLEDVQLFEEHGSKQETL